MQVKKFEAKTMRDALELVKTHLGPEAIILSAKDNSRGFGLVGQKSVEVTAAISEETLKRKRLAEQKLSPQTRARLQQAPARTQRRYIERAVEEVLRNSEPPMPQSVVPPRYVDILDDEDSGLSLPSKRSTATARQRVQDATRRAREAFEASEALHEKDAKQSNKVIAQEREILELKHQIEELRRIIAEFQKIPQSFVARHPGADEGIGYELSPLYQKLLRLGLNEELSVTYLKRAQEQLPKKELERTALMEAWVARQVMDEIRVGGGTEADRLEVFMGPPGQGKTSVLVKIASHITLVHRKRVAIVCSDARKVGAAEQLRIFAQILNVPFAVVSKHQDWDDILASLGSVEHILVDMPGLSLRSEEEMVRLRSLLPEIKWGRRLHYVQSLLPHDQVAFEVADRYRALGFDDVIFTGIDESAHQGMMVNFQKRYQVPIHSWSTGPAIPEDWEVATKERVVDIVFKMSKPKREMGADR